MECPKCKAAVPDGSAFCNRCGAPTGAPAAAPAPAPPEPEKEVWRGRFSGKAHAHRVFLLALWAAALIYLYVKLRPHGSWEWIKYGFAAAALLPFLWILGSWFIARFTVRYRLTTHRLFREKGFIFRTINEVELIRVDDVSVSQNMIQRIFNVGNVTVIAPTDPTEPRLDLVGIENPIEVKEQIRNFARLRREKTLHVESL